VPQEKILPIYNAVQCEPVLPVVMPLSTPFKLITVGRLIALKQIDRLIRAIRNRETLGLVIVGDGPERNRLESITREQGLGGRVYFAGQKTKQETLALMAGCDLFVLNSTHEGFPHVVLEAMCVGLPVLATAVGGTPELVFDGENGVLISPTSEDDLSKAIERLINSSAERARLVNGARRTVERFRHSTMIEQTEAALMRTWKKAAAVERDAAAVRQHAN
jgi:glycosyltransferase involved in cell wall biosynthesis